MVGHEFRHSYSVVRNDIPNVDYELAYTVGNPMGAYSS